MPQVAGRPIGVAVLVGILILHAFAFLADAVDFVDWLAPNSPVTTSLRSLGVPFAFAAVAAAVLLLRRAFLLWTFHPGAWWVTLGLFVLKAVFALLVLATSGNFVRAGTSLLLPAAGIALLLTPSVRQQFPRRAANRTHRTPRR